MFFINVIIILLYIMLAILSRKHYSKYKGGKGLINKLIGLHMAMGETVIKLFKISDKREDIQKNLRKVNVVSSKGLEDLTRKYITASIAICIALLIVFNVVSGIVYILDKVNPKTTSNVIERNDYSKGNEEYLIYLTLQGKTYEYLLSVAPREYTEKEFIEKGGEVLASLEESFLGDNQSMEQIHTDMVLYPEEVPDEFDLEWHSSNPTLIDTNGRVYQENVKNTEEVILTACLTYLDFTLEREYKVFIVDDVSDEGVIRETQKVLEELEAGNRNDKFIELPQYIKEVKVGLSTKTNHSNIKVFMLGILACVVALTLKREKLASAGRERDNMLLKMYPAFVNKLWLLLGTGMTMKSSLIHIISEAREKNILVRELEYSLNQIRTGIDEALVYEELGRRLNLPIYIRLMNQISHNLKRGNSDLLDYMEEEVSSSLEMKKECGKRLGEEASTKLLFPMIMLMAVVMIIVIVPAMTGF